MTFGTVDEISPAMNVSSPEWNLNTCFSYLVLNTETSGQRITPQECTSDCFTCSMLRLSKAPLVYKTVCPSSIFEKFNASAQLLTYFSGLKSTLTPLMLPFVLRPAVMLSWWGTNLLGWEVTKWFNHKKIMSVMSCQLIYCNIVIDL